VDTQQTPVAMDNLTRLAETIHQLVIAANRQQQRSEKTILFLDNSNFFGSVTRIGRDKNQRLRVDYRKLLRVAMRDRFVIDARCYYSEWEADPSTQQRRDGFQIALERAGFTVVRFQQRPGARAEKGVDAAIVKDMVTMARECPRCDTFVLIAGDGDYTETVREIRKKYGVKVEVAFFAPETAIALREAAYHFIDLEPMQELIQLDRAVTE